LGKKNVVPDVEVPIADPTGWMLNNSISDFILMHTFEIQFMCMVAYCFSGGVKVFSSAKPESSTAYKFVNLVFTCTGGGIIVPVILNSLPVPISNDFYVIAILISFTINLYFPIIREVYKVSTIFRVTITVMFEINRAFIVTKFTQMAANTIPASTWSFAVFGPIFCGAISGCGGAFLPFSKGLEPMVNGLAPPMLTAMVGAAGYHLYLNTSISDDCINAKEKAKLHVGLFFVAVALIDTLGVGSKKAGGKDTKDTAGKKEN